MKNKLLRRLQHPAARLRIVLIFCAVEFNTIGTAGLPRQSLLFGIDSALLQGSLQLLQLLVKVRVDI